MPERGRFIGATSSVLRAATGSSAPVVVASAVNPEPTPESVTWSGADFLGSDWVALERYGDSSNGELQGYATDNVFVNGSGYLEIKAEVAVSHGGAYRSGMLQWVPGLTFTHGTLEVRARLPGGAGPWPAIWLLGIGCQIGNIGDANPGGTCVWPDVGEIDFVETLGASPRTNLNAVVHRSGGSPGGQVAVGADMAAGFHTYHLTRSPGQIVWRFDGTVVQTINDAVADASMFCIMNVAVGGTGGGSVTDATLPQSMFIDYMTLTPAN